MEKKPIQKAKLVEFTTSTGKKIELAIVPDHDATGYPAADFFDQNILVDPEKQKTVCFSTGSSPLPMYRELIRRQKKQGKSFANIRSFLLDEYMGLPAGHPACFRSFMFENLYNHADFSPDNLHVFFGPKEDHMQTCFRYEMELSASGGVDLMILGIGKNGHIAFNEPGTRPDSRTRMIKLDESTRKANAMYFNSIDEVPTHALSVGIGNILEAKSLLLIASGDSKAEIIKKALTGPVTDQIPASNLQTFQGELMVVLDEKAAADLKSVDKE